MMNRNRDLGKTGEELAIQFLKERGVQILERNWRMGRNELDIIGFKFPVLLFIEVKTRTGQKFGKPEDAVDTKKESSIRKAAQCYLNQSKFQGEIRFDIISILLDFNNKALEIKQFEDAFFPGL